MGEKNCTGKWLDEIEAKSMWDPLEEFEALLECAPDQEHPMFHYFVGFVHGRILFEQLGGGCTLST